MQFIESSAYRVGFTGVVIDGARYFVPDYAAHRPAGQAILKGRYYEPRTHALVRLLLESLPGNIVHAGTFFGDMLPSFSRACGTAGRVYAFEPLLENHVLARLTVDANRLENVVLFNAGLGAALASCLMARGSAAGTHAGGASKVSPRGDASATLMTIDSLGLTQLSILQLDVEGHELEALTGARRTIAACRPVIMIEDNGRACAPLLGQSSYVFAGQIPGLDIWLPAGADGAADVVSRFLAKRR